MQEAGKSLLRSEEFMSQGGWETYAKLSSLRIVGLWPFMWEVVEDIKLQQIPVLLHATIGSTKMSAQDEGLFIVEFAGTDQLLFEDSERTDTHSFLDLTMVYNFHEGRKIENNQYSSHVGDAITARALPRGEILLFHGTHIFEQGKVVYEAAKYKSGNLAIHPEGPAHTQFRRLLGKFPPLQPRDPFTKRSWKAPQVAVVE
ncbi:MAG: hypothetical protein Q8Q49_06045 [bacterium]|nr:hypothetical protein [bacterium]